MQDPATTHVLDLPLGLRSLLEAVQRDLRPGSVASALTRLFRGLEALRRSQEDAAWEATCRAARAHPVARRLLLCPLTRHAHDRPRGYPGDAALLDWIYDGPDGHPGDDTPPLGRELYRCISAAPAAEAVRGRRSGVAGALDEVARRRSGARALSVACGHLREAEISSACRTGALDELVAVDQDPASLREVSRIGARLAAAHATAGTSATTLVPIQGSVADVLARRLALGTFDLVYSAGLYDYLVDRVAQRLTSRLLDLLRPGGELLLYHFVPGVPDRGFMETYLRWNLIYRSEEDLLALLGPVLEGRVASVEVERDDTGCVCSLRATRW